VHDAILTRGGSAAASSDDAELSSSEFFPSELDFVSDLSSPVVSASLASAYNHPAYPGWDVKNTHRNS